MNNSNPILGLSPSLPKDANLIEIWKNAEIKCH